MSIFDGLFRSRDKPQNRTAGSSYAFYMGGSSSGKAVTERSAMQMTAVYSCVRILAEAIAGLPLHLYRYTEAGGKEKATNHPLYLLLHDEPNPEMSSFVGGDMSLKPWPKGTTVKPMPSRFCTICTAPQRSKAISRMLNRSPSRSMNFSMYP